LQHNRCVEQTDIAGHTSQNRPRYRAGSRSEIASNKGLRFADPAVTTAGSDSCRNDYMIYNEKGCPLGSLLIDL